MMSETDFLDVASTAARKAGQILQDWAGRFSVSEKSPANLVTEADVASQTAVYEHIHSHFPDHRFLGEEDLNMGESDSPYRWIIDPLDGTSNYVHQFPYYCVSIALERDGELIAAAIFDPTRDDLYMASRGNGAYLNNKPIRTSAVDEVSRTFAVASLPIRAGIEDVAVQRFVKMLTIAQTVQRTGSAALNLANVACGHLDAFWASSLYPWDIAAGVLLIREAGGQVTQMDGSELILEKMSLLATNGTAIHKQLQRYLA